MVPATTPKWIQLLIPGVVWHMPRTEKSIYLTFDDGPIPQVTPWVLDLLFSYQAKATFFCLGKNVEQHPTIFERIKAEGHTVGNHSYSHAFGWKMSKDQYLKDVKNCEAVFSSAYFRPPYGKASNAQLKRLKEAYKIVLWSVLSKDYSSSTSAEKCLSNSLNCGPGDIIVFHDSEKAKENLSYVLPRFLAHYSNAGYTFKAL